MGARTTRDIAEFVCKTSIHDLPPEVIAHVKMLALSHVGMNIAGSCMDFGRTVNHYIMGKGGYSEAGVFGAGYRTCVDYAALANGNAAHATELEDTNARSMSSVGYWSTVFAMGEKLNLTGKDVIGGFVIGYEIASKLGVAYKNAHASGRQNAACSALGNAASAAKMLGLNVEQMASALSLAASQVAGIRNQAGSGAHVIEAGFAGRNGIWAAELAALGYTGQPDILEGKRGFGDVWAGCPEFDLTLGEDYSVMGVGIRKYSCCGPAHRYIDAMLALIAEHHIAWADVANVEHGIHHTRLHSFRFEEPADAEQAHFSLPHITVACFFDKNAFLPSFTEEKVRDPRWREARQKVRVTVHREPVDGSSFESPVTITMKNGKSYRKICHSAKADPDKARFGTEDAMKKYRDCMDFAGTYSRARVDQIAQMTLDLDKVADVSTLTALLTFPDKA